MNKDYFGFVKKETKPQRKPSSASCRLSARAKFSSFESLTSAGHYTVLQILLVLPKCYTIRQDRTRIKINYSKCMSIKL